jgi:hypothetical protein
MPQSTFSVRPRARGLRVLKFASALALVLAVAALLVRLIGGEETKAEPIGRVAFLSKLDVVSQRSAEPSQQAAAAEQQAIVTLITDWYQRAFVDPRLWGDGTFPEVAALFQGAAAAAFRRDIDSLTIGDARTELTRVRPRGARVTITLYFDDDRAPFAIASVVFNATGVLKQEAKDEEAPTLDIRQKATLYLSKTAQGWRVFAYDADQNQDTIEPEATPS